MMQKIHMSNYPEKTNPGKLLTLFQRQMLQKRLQQDLPESYRQRIEIMLLADEGKTQIEICQTLKCSPATARHWIHIARTGMAHQWQDCPLGRPKAVNDQYLERLRELACHSPHDYGYSFRRWTGNWLSQHLAKELGIIVSGHHINRLLKQMGLSMRSKPRNQGEHKSKILIGDLQSEKMSDYTGFSLFTLVL
jgi:transposase